VSVSVGEEFKMSSTTTTQAPPVSVYAIAPVVKLASNTAVFERMARDIDLSAGGVIDGTETIDEVGARVFEHVRRVASGEVSARAEEHKHREFQFWAEQTVSL
jgi:altronate dehydratase